MKILLIVVSAAITVCMGMGISISRENKLNCNGKDLEGRMECEVIKLLNDYRVRKGRKKLMHANQCYQMAKSHAQIMKKYKKMSHEVLRGQGPDERANKFGLGKARNAINQRSNLRYSGENIARYYPTPEDVMRSWRWSLWGHNSNMLRRNHTHVGVGLAVGRDHRGAPIKDQYYWVQVFCTRR